MAVTITAVELCYAMRLGSSAEELAEATRLLAFSTTMVIKHVATAPDTIHNESVIRLASYVFDQPTAARGDGYGNAIRNSGAARMLLPYRVHRAGYADSMDAAQQAVGTVGNPVTGLALVANVLTVTFADGSTATLTFEAGGMGGADQTARASIAAHEATTHNTDVAARATINSHVGMQHNTDETARNAANNARSVADQSATDVADHAASTHNTDAPARATGQTNTGNINSHIANHLPGVTPADRARLAPDPTTGQSGDVAEVNPQRNGYILAHLPDIGNDHIPHVGRLPAPSVLTPDIVLLTHTHTMGFREDAVLTVGFSGVLAGYNANAPAYGAISRPSPLLRIFGLGNASSYSLQDFTSFSDDWLSEFQFVVINNVEYEFGTLLREGGFWYKRALNYPEGQSLAEITLNFKRYAGTYYFTDSSGGSDDAGLYVKRDNGQEGFLYSHLISFGDVHGTGVGPPLNNPDQGGATYINALGNMWTAAGQEFTIITPAVGTDSAFTHAKYVPLPNNLPDILSIAGDGGFWWDWSVATPGFVQFQGPSNSDYTPNRTWAEIWAYILTLNGQNTAINRALAASIYLGRVGSLQDAVERLQIVIEGGETFAANKFYYGNTSDIHVRRINTFTLGNIRLGNDFHWVGPFATEAYVDEKVGEVGGANPKSRYLIGFPASSYSYMSLADGGWDPGGTSVLTAPYPSGVTQALLRTKGFYAVLQTDLADTVFGQRRLMTDWQQDLMLSDYADPKDRYIQIRLNASDMTLVLQGTELATAVERDNWTLFLTVI